MVAQEDISFANNYINRNMNLKEYQPGCYDATVGKEQRKKAANISRFNADKNQILLTVDVLDSIGLFLIPFQKEGKIGFINKEGEIVVEPTYDKIIGNFRSKDNFIAVCKDKKWSVIDFEGKEMINYVNHIIIPGYDCHLASIQNQSKSKVINVLTKEVIVDSQYDFIDGFRYGYARVRIGDNINGKWGIINQSGKLILPTIYAAVYSFYDFPKNTTVLKLFKDSDELFVSLDNLEEIAKKRQ